MKDLLKTIAAEINTAGGTVAAVDVVNVPKGNGVPWKRLVLSLTDKDGLVSRPLLSVVVPPTKYPVTVDYHHVDPQQVTGHRYEWGRDPNATHPDNPPTIDSREELEKMLRGLLGLPETALILKRMGE